MWMADILITWAGRSVHVFGAAIWLGGYAVMLLVIVPYLARERNETIRGVAQATVRRWALAGLVVGALAVLMMTRAIYAR
jgi:putative copper export protein